MFISSGLGHRLKFPNYEFLSLKIAFSLANIADTDEMPHNAAFRLCLHSFQQFPFTSVDCKRDFESVYLTIFHFFRLSIQFPEKDEVTSDKSSKCENFICRNVCWALRVNTRYISEKKKKTY